MWSALKSDLLDFVTTIQEDTTKTISKVLGDDQIDGHTDDKGDDEAMIAKWIADTKRSYETYSLPLRENRVKEFEKFKKKFSLSSFSGQIASILDEEPEVSRFYAELVPISISPEEFWARLFFRLHLLNRTGNVLYEADEEDEEELVWEDENDGAAQSTESNSDSPKLSPVIANAELESLKLENKDLKQQIQSLQKRIAELEASLNISERTVADKLTPIEETIVNDSKLFHGNLTTISSSDISNVDSEGDMSTSSSIVIVEVPPKPTTNTSSSPSLQAGFMPTSAEKARTAFAKLEEEADEEDDGWG